MSDLIAILYGLFGASLPLIGSALVPNGLQRIGAGAFALVGLGILTNFFTAPDPSGFLIGLLIGFMLATAKLALGIRFF